MFLGTTVRLVSVGRDRNIVHRNGKASGKRSPFSDKDFSRYPKLSAKKAKLHVVLSSTIEKKLYRLIFCYLNNSISVSPLVIPI